MAAPNGLVLPWPSTAASIPSGWSRVTAMDDKYPKASATMASTGGSATHTHTPSSHTHTQSHVHGVTTSAASPPASNATNISGLTVQTNANHSHNSSNSGSNATGMSADTPSASSSSNGEPNSYTVIWIQSNGTTDIHVSTLAWWDQTSAPTNWGIADGTGTTPDLRNYFLKGAAAAADGGTGTAASAHGHTYGHNHPVASHNHTNPSQTGSPTTNNTQIAQTGAVATTLSSGHAHSFTGSIASQAGTSATTTPSSDTTTPDPLFTKLHHIQKTSADSALPTGIIGLWISGAVPVGWQECDGTNGTPTLDDAANPYVKGANGDGERDSTGGADSHSHNISTHLHGVGTHAHTGSTIAVSSVTSAAVNASSASASSADDHSSQHATVTIANASGTNSGSATNLSLPTSSGNNEPPFYTAKFIQKVIVTVTKDVTSTGVTTCKVVKNVTSSGVITETPTLDVTSTVVITRTPTLDVTSTADVTRTPSLDVTSTAVVTRTPVLNVTSSSVITCVVVSNVTSSGVVTMTLVLNVSSSAALGNPVTGDVTSNADIVKPFYNVTSNADATRTPTASVDSNSAVTAMISLDVLSSAVVLPPHGFDVSSDAAIHVNVTVTADVTSTSYITIGTGIADVDSSAQLTLATVVVATTGVVTCTVTLDVTSQTALILTPPLDVGTNANLGLIESIDVTTLGATLYKNSVDVTSSSSINHSIEVTSSSATSTTGTTDVTTTAVLTATVSLIGTAGVITCVVNRSTTSSADVTTSGIKDVTSTGASTRTITSDVTTTVSVGSAQPVTGGGAVRIDIYTPDGITKKSSGPITKVLSCEYGLVLDQVGDFLFEVPANDPRIPDLVQGNDIWINIENEGLTFKGTISDATFKLQGEAWVLEVKGSSIARRTVVRKTTNFGRVFNSVSPLSALTTLLTGTRYAPGSVGNGGSIGTFTATYNASSIWAAIDNFRKIFQYHMRENPVQGTIDLDVFGDATALLFANVSTAWPVHEQNPLVVPITNFTKHQSSFNLTNKVYVYGGGSGPAQLDLKMSTRTTPYTIQTEVGPDGVTRYFLADAASIALYGQYEDILVAADVVPISNSTPAFQASANVLYDLGVQYLLQKRIPVEDYTAEVLGLRHLDGVGTQQFKVGQTVRVRYQGSAGNIDGTTNNYLNVDTALWIMGMRRTIDQNGMSKWVFTLSTSDQLADNAATKIALMQSTVHSLSTSLGVYVAQAFHYRRDSLDDTHPMTFTVDYDTNTHMVHLVKIVGRINPLRSNVSTASAGGQTSTSSGSSSATSSSAGSTHGHTIQPQSSNAGGAHRHVMMHWDASLQGSAGGVNGLSDHTGLAMDPNNLQTPLPNTSGWDGSGKETAFIGTTLGSDHKHGVGDASGHVHAYSHFHWEQGSTFYYVDQAKFGQLGGASPHSDLATYETSIDHIHLIGAQISGGESAHTHGIAHTHTITLSNHTHALVYGIFIDTNPSAVHITVAINGVDHTAALGGPFDSNFTVDATQFFVDVNGQPLRQDNPISFGCATGKRLDLEVTVRSLLSATAILPT